MFTPSRFLAAAGAAIVVCLALAGCGPAGDEAPIAEAPRADERWLADVDLATFLDCAREQRVTLLQAHRAGDRPGAAENSLRAIEASLADGAVFIELDVAQTADGVLVLMHDDTVDRTTNGRGEIRSLRLADLASLELVDVNGRRTGESPPTLEAALAALDGRGIAQLDLKDISLESLAAALRRQDAVDRAVVITYSLDDAIALHRLLPEVMISAGLFGYRDLDRLERAGVDLTRIQGWLGLGTGEPAFDTELARRGIETSYGDFRAEREGSVNYRLMARNGAEVISVDQVPAAARALDAAMSARELLSACPAAG